MTAKSVNRTRLLMVAAIFLLPVILAKIALEAGFFNKGATNKGQLLDPTVSLSPVYKAEKAKWRLLYVLPEHCPQDCKNALYSLNQVWLALGKHMDRVEPLVLANKGQAERLELLNSEYPAIKMLQVSQQIVNNVFKDVGVDGIFIVDTLDNVILRYPLQQEQQQAVLHSREILADMRKLLKLSRIG